MKKQTWKTIKFLFILTFLTGIIYPIFITSLSRIIFPDKAEGSLIISDGRVIGSELIGQKFDSVAYFWSRPSAIDYSPIPSGASNLGPTSDKLLKMAKERKARFINENFLDSNITIPAEMIHASASGLDPHISPNAALLQVERICKVRNFSSDEKQTLLSIIDKQTEKPQYLIFGEERINILLLNLELDKIQ